jgi:hypothetical protein
LRALLRSPALAFFRHLRLRICSFSEILAAPSYRTHTARQRVLESGQTSRTGISFAIGPRVLVRGVGFGALGLIAATLCNHMNVAAEMILLVFVLAPVVLIGVIFVWGARKDGQEDRAVQARLGIRRRTRLGR